MKINTINDAVRVASICEKYPYLEIDAKCEGSRYIVDAKSMMGLTLMIGRGKLFLKVIDPSKPGYESFINEMGELDIAIEKE